MHQLGKYFEVMVQPFRLGVFVPVAEFISSSLLNQQITSFCTSVAFLQQTSLISITFFVPRQRKEKFSIGKNNTTQNYFTKNEDEVVSQAILGK